MKAEKFLAFAGVIMAPIVVAVAMVAVPKVTAILFGLLWFGVYLPYVVYGLALIVTGLLGLGKNEWFGTAIA
jgi:hypothetical protein